MQSWCEKLVAAKWFGNCILIIIVINSLALAGETMPSLSAWQHLCLRWVDLACISIFVVEAVLKLTAWRLHYFKSSWNIFDFIIVVVAIMPFSHYASVLRALRILRALRLIEHVPSLKRVVNALAVSIPGLLSTGALLALVYFIAGVMGVKLFGADFPQWFGHLGRSWFSLFQIMTLESWSSGIVRPIMEMYPYAWLFFVPFILISAFILLNFLIGIVVDAIAHLKYDEAEKNTTSTLDEIVERLKEIEKKLR